jgi:hypothetical protein
MPNDPILFRSHINGIAAERRAIRAEMAALSRRAIEAGLPAMALVLDLALAMDPDEDYPRSPD